MDKYTRFFEATNPSFLFESIYVNSYNDLDCCVIKEGESVIVLFKNLEDKNCQQEALEIFSDDVKFAEYHKNFEDFLKVAKTKSEELVNDNQLIKLIDLFLDFLKMYRYTEAFYTELAYKVFKEQQDDNLGKNLKLLEKIKTNARIYLNSFFNGQQSYLSRAIEKSESPDEIIYYSVEELKNKIDINIEEIKKRKESHILYKNNQIYDKNTLEFKNLKEWKDASVNSIGKILKGTAASRGKITGKAYVLSSNFNNFEELDSIIENMPNDIILVSETTAPDIVKACFKAKAIVTNQGGMGSHAAIISRELKIPCVVGCKIATKVVNTGDIITVDGNNGVVILDGE